MTCCAINQLIAGTPSAWSAMAAFDSLLPLRKRPTSQFCIATPRRRGRNPKQTQLPKRRVELIGCSLPNPSSAKSLLKLVVLSGRASWGPFFGGTMVRPPNPPVWKRAASPESKRTECSTRTSNEARSFREANESPSTAQTPARMGM
jgi:hypothetical protein